MTSDHGITMIITLKHRLLPEYHLFFYLCVHRDGVAVKNSFGLKLKLRKEKMT